MKKVCAILTLIIVVCALCSCYEFDLEEWQPNDEINNDTYENNGVSDEDNNQYAEYKKQYINASALKYGRNATIKSFIDYFENKLSDNIFPRVVKYYLQDLDYYDEEWGILQSCDATYCYKYYDGRQNSSGNPVYLREIYLMPEVELFYVQNRTYYYSSLTYPDAVNYVYTRTASFAFKLGNTADQPMYGGIYTHQAFSTSTIAEYNIVYTYDISSMIVPANLPLRSDVSVSYSWGDTTNLVEAQEHADINGEAENIYEVLQGAFAFCQSCFEKVDSAYKLLS